MYNNYSVYPNQFSQNQFGYQPNNVQQQYQPTYQNQYVQQQQYQQPYDNDYLVGKIVDSIDVVKAINADLSGKANYYPKSDGSEIYCKRINPQTGASGIQTYVLKMDYVDNNSSSEKQYNISDISKQINELKDLILENITRPQNGGDK